MLIRTLRIAVLALSVTMATPTWAVELEQVIAGSHRKEEDKARDQYRHPLETLRFIGLKPGMTVVEVLPIGGWYTNILAPYLKEHGAYYGALFPEDDTSDGGFWKRGREGFVRDMSNKELYGTLHLVTLAPERGVKMMPDGAADMVLTFRNVHNWMAAGTAEQTFATFFAALKPGGVLGVVEHRASDKGKQDPKAASGYVQQAYVIKLATDAGFRLTGQSEINANPKDTKDYPGGVWTLPPGYAKGNEDRARYATIGESDRMTLKFVKPDGAQH